MLMNDDKYYMKLALAEAQKAFDAGEVPIGAVLVDEDGIVVSRGYNLRETNKDALAHAEVEAIRKANSSQKRWRLSGTTLYVTIEPCPMCAGAIVAMCYVPAGIKHDTRIGELLAGGSVFTLLWSLL